MTLTGWLVYNSDAFFGVGDCYQVAGVGYDRSVGLAADYVISLAVDSCYRLCVASVTVPV